MLLGLSVVIQGARGRPQSRLKHHPVLGTVRPPCARAPTQRNPTPPRSMAKVSQVPARARCNKNLYMSMCQSAKNPGRLYLKCPKRFCDFFEWVDREPRGKNKAWLKGNTSLLDPKLWEQNKEEYATRVLCQLSCQAIAKQKDLQCLKCREKTGPFEGNSDAQNLMKNQRSMVD